MALAGVETFAVPAPAGAVDTALELLDGVYGFVFSRVGNRFDAEDLTQQVAMKALPRLREGAPQAEIRGYLFTTARSVLATFWEGRSRAAESELDENLVPAAPVERRASIAAESSVAEILARLRPSHRRLLELRFLRGYTLKEVAAAMGKTEGAVKVMQLRALRAAATTIPGGWEGWPPPEAA